MFTRRSMFMIVVAVGAFRADFARGQYEPPPLHLDSLESWVADSDVVVRGVIVDIVADPGNWNIVTLDVLETLKGVKARRLQFAAHKLDKTDAALAEFKQSKQETLWLLKRQGSGVPGEAPDREKAMAGRKIDLHAPFPSGRPGAPWLPVIPLGDATQPLAFLTVDLRVLKTSRELVEAIRAAILETSGRETYFVALPKEIALRTGFSGHKNLLAMPRDHRLEHVARRLVQSPGEFLAKNDPEEIRQLRLEGIRALRLFPSEKNLAIARAWLDDPMSSASFKKDGTAHLVPAMPKERRTEAKIVLPLELARVPEIHFQQPLTKAMKTEDAQLHAAVTIDGAHFLNRTKTDAFIAALMSKRPDLAGLPFAMGDSCRMKPEAGRQFVAALDAFQKSKSEDEKKVVLMSRYKELAKEKKIDPSASVASLMQVLGHEEGAVRLALVNYLGELPNADATQALAKMAVFSAEPDIRAAAVAALKDRDDDDYTDILLAGLNYPWPAVAERSCDAIVKLGRTDLIPQLIEASNSPDPRTPRTQETNGKNVSVVRELVRVNHHHSCLLCHAPATTARDNSSKEEAAKLDGLTAQIPVPSESMVAYYRPSSPDILVRFDVTYLRQDFSMKLPVAGADPWPEMQRYDFLVRTRALTEKEALAHRELLRPSRPDGVSPYRLAALSAIRALTGDD